MRTKFTLICMLIFAAFISLNAQYIGTGFGYYTIAAKSDGTVYTWGQNDEGQLGIGNTTNSNVPVAVDTSGVLYGKTITQVAGGSYHSIALASDGTVYTWGLNNNGQLGNGNTTNSNVPVAVSTTGTPMAGKTITQVAAGANHCIVLASDGTVYTWGSNGYGQLGNENNTNSNVPVAVVTNGVLSGKTITQVAAGGYHSIALASDGTVYTWGRNSNGQLGNENNTNSNVPVAVVTNGVLSGKTITQVAASASHCIVLASDGTVYTWGRNIEGQLGNGKSGGYTDSNVPVAVITSGVLSGKKITQVAAGSSHSIALASDGTVYTWGRNSEGELGNGNNTSSNVPVEVITSGVLSGKTITQVASGSSHSIALASDGTVYTWGRNSEGELGNGNNTSSNVPVVVLDLNLGLDLTDIQLIVDEQEGFVLDTVSVPVSVQFPSTKEYSSAEIDFSGFQSGLEFLGVDMVGTMVGEAGWTYTLNQTETLLKTSFAGANDISGSGVFCKLKFLVTGQPNSFVPVTIESAVFNTGEDYVAITNGGVEIQETPIIVYGDVDGNSLIQAYDASLILKYLVGYDSLSVQALVKANVSMDSSVSSLDASIILKYVVELIDTLPYDTTQGNMAATGELFAENIIVGSNDIGFPIYLKNGNNILSFEGVIEFDNTVLEYESASWSELLSNFAIEVNVVGNKIYIAGSSAIPDGESDTFVTLQFKKIANIESTEIMIEKYRFNEEDYQTGNSAQIIVGVEEENNLPTEYSLSQNYPNPFNPSTEIKFAIPQDSQVKLELYNALGEKVATLINEEMSAGFHNYQLSISNYQLPSGVYFYKLQSGNFVETKKMILMK